MPKAPKSKPCGSKRAAALTKCPLTQGWGCRNCWAQPGLPGMVSQGWAPQGYGGCWEHPTAQKWFEFLVGMAEVAHGGGPPRRGHKQHQ